jgi:Protein of unknown function (DUF2795)
MSSNPQFTEQHEIASAMKGAEFPVHRDELLQVAKRNHAPDNVLKDLQRLDEDRAYGTVAEVMHELGHHAS